MSSDIAKAWAKKQKVAPLQKFLLITLADYVNEDFECWPSNRTLAEATSMHVNSVNRNARALIESEHLILVSQGGFGKKSSRYRFNIEAGEVLEVPVVVKIESNEGLERFDEFWSAYPKKVSKPAAKKAFRRADGDNNIEAIVKCLKKLNGYSGEWTKMREQGRGQYIPNPATWLNNEKWLDQDDTVTVTFEDF